MAMAAKKIVENSGALMRCVAVNGACATHYGLPIERGGWCAVRLGWESLRAAIAYNYDDVVAVARAITTNQRVRFADKRPSADGQGQETQCIVAANAPTCNWWGDWAEMPALTSPRSNRAHFGFCPSCAAQVRAAGITFSYESLYEAITGRKPTTSPAAVAAPAASPAKPIGRMLEFPQRAPGAAVQESARCIVCADVTGNPNERLPYVPRFDVVERTTAEACFGHLADTSSRYWDLLRMHAEADVSDAELRRPDGPARKEAKGAAKVCALHGREFRALGTFRRDVIEHIKNNWPAAWTSRGNNSAAPAAVGAETCSACRARVAKLFGDPPTLCGRCNKCNKARARREEAERARATRRAANRKRAEEMGAGKKTGSSGKGKKGGHKK